jgi:hypothetical protein
VPGPLVARIGRRRVVQAGGVVAALGSALAIAAPRTALAVLHGSPADRWPGASGRLSAALGLLVAVSVSMSVLAGRLRVVRDDGGTLAGQSGAR